MSKAEEVTTVPFDEDIGSREMLERYWRLQNHNPVARVMTSAGHEAWLVSRYEDVKTLLADQRLGRSHPDPESAPRWHASLGGGPSMDFETETVERTATRKAMAAPLSPRRVEVLQPQASAIANELLDSVLAKSAPAHCLSTYAWPLPERVASLHLGIPPEFDIPVGEMQRFLASGDVFAASNVTEIGRGANGKMNGLIEFAIELIAAKKAYPGDDLLSELTQAQDEPDGLTESQILFTTLVLLMSASGSTAIRIETGIGLFHAHPDQYAALVREPRLVASAVNEIMRLCNGIYDPTIRYARSDFELRDVAIKTGDLVLLDITSAHCDPRAFPDPLKFDITRHPNKQIGFGQGSTRCAGVALARLSLETAFRVLAGRCAKLPFIPSPPPRDRPLAIW